MPQDDIDLGKLRSYRDWRDQMTKRRYNELISATRTDSPITFYPSVTIDSWGVVTFGEWGGYLFQVHPLGYHDRLVLTPLTNPAVYHYGYDYAKGLVALKAALRWDPQRRGEPNGYIRRIGGRRLSGQQIRTALPGTRTTSITQITAQSRSATRRQPKGR